MKWTESEDAMLRELYAKHNRSEMAIRLGRTEGMVRSRCCTLGLNTKTAAPWSDREVGIIRQFYEAAKGLPVNLGRLSSLLQRPKTSVCKKARELGYTSYTRPKTAQLSLPKANRYATAEDLRAAKSRTQKAWIAEHGHPRGALGMKHSDEVKAACSARLKSAWADQTSLLNSPEHRQALSDRLAKMAADRVQAGEGPYSRTAHGRRADLGNRYFRSAWEANYARYLNLQVAQGGIASWDYECKTFWFEAIKRGTRSYTPDFKVVAHDGSHVWHEVKGWMDAKSKTKLDRMNRYYPGERVIVIGEEWFKSAKKGGLSGILPGWETKGKHRAK